MCRKIVQICSAVLLVASAGVQAGGPPDLLSAHCVDQSDRLAMRTLRSECDISATESYHVGISRPANPNDDLSVLEGVPDCENSNPGYGPGNGRGYGRGYGDDSGDGYGDGYGDDYGDGYGGSSTLYVCLGAPSIY